MIRVRIQKRFAPGPESSGFSLDVDFEAGAAVTVLFGSSGAGKTLTLDCIAGFVRPDAGRILLDDGILFDAGAGVSLPPRKRDCGYVFQSYALFPHMTLRENLMFGAERRPPLERHRRVNEMLDRFRIADVAGRRPHEVSGGQKQRCSIARALIGGPRLLLLDEPARGLDAPLRAEFYDVVRQIAAEFKTPVLLVTHDLEEAFALGDHMLVMREGKVVQSGAPRQVLDQPSSLDVARLLGCENLMEAEIAALDPGRNTSRLRILGGAHEIEGTYYPGHLIGDRVWLLAPASALRIADGAGSIPMEWKKAGERPRGVRVELDTGIAVELSRQDFEELRLNRQWRVAFPSEALRVLR